MPEPHPTISFARKVTASPHSALRLRPNFWGRDIVLRAIIATIALLVATVTCQAQSEITLLCTGTAERVLKHRGTVDSDKREPVSGSLIVTPNDTINWQGNVANWVSWWTDPVYFNWHRLYKGENGEHYFSYDGSIDRVTGRAHIRHDNIETNSNSTETVDYDLFCKPTKLLF
jgi:hypothetical protein